MGIPPPLPRRRRRKGISVGSSSLVSPRERRPEEGGGGGALTELRVFPYKNQREERRRRKSFSLSFRFPHIFVEGKRKRKKAYCCSSFSRLLKRRNYIFFPGKSEEAETDENCVVERSYGILFNLRAHFPPFPGNVVRKKKGKKIAKTLPDH